MFRFAAFLSGVLTVLALVLFSPHLLRDTDSRASYWIAKVLRYQDGLLEHSAGTDRPRLIIIGGSNGIYGFDGYYLEKYSSYDVVNMSVHVGFDPQFYNQRLRGRLKPGDIVVATLEHPLYRRDTMTDFHQEQNLLWLQRFFDYDTPLERLHANLATPSAIYAKLIWAKLTRPPRDIARYVDDTESHARAPLVMDRMRPLHVSLADEHGFFVVPIEMSDELRKTFARNRRPYSNLPVQAAGPTRTVGTLLQLQSTVEAQGGRLFVTWPAMADIRAHSSHDDELLDRYARFRAAMTARGLNFICDAKSMMLPPQYFFDTVYHVNAWGAIARSIRLAQCLKRNHLPFAAVVDTHTVRNQLGIRRERKRMRAPFEVVREEIEALQAALEAYRADHGEYPKSSNNGIDWDGLHSKWGRSTENWIAGLAPRYVSTLPRDWRGSDSPDYQYLYRSNGRFYKIMNRRPPDCELAKLILPEFVDPSRDCWAYSGWVGIARTW